MYKLPRYCLPSFEPIRLLVQKFKIDFIKMAVILDFQSERFDVQLAPILPGRLRKLAFQLSRRLSK